MFSRVTKPTHRLQFSQWLQEQLDHATAPGNGLVFRCADVLQGIGSGVVVVAGTSLRSPRKSCIFSIRNSIHRMKAFQKTTV